MNFLLNLLLLVAVVVARASGDYYGNDPNIYELNPSNFNNVVYKSNYTSIVKFYAPWCGYCKQLEPIYHKLARFLHSDGKYAVNVGSVNCDKEYNKPLCSEHKIQGFPTLLVFRPPKHKKGTSKSAKHVPEVYNGERTLVPMVDFLFSRIKNYVKKFHNFKSDTLPKWLEQPGHKVLLVSSSNTIQAMYKTMAIDFLESVLFGMITSTSEQATIVVDGVEVEVPLGSLPVLLAYKPEEKRFEKYDGKLKNKNKLEKWVSKEFGVAAGEGALSRKDKKFLSKYRGGPKKDEL